MDMLVEYRFDNKYWYDVNGVIILLKCSRSQAKKIMKDSVVTYIKYLNKKLYLKSEVIELANLNNLKGEIKLRFNRLNEEGER